MILASIFCIFFAFDLSTLFPLMIIVAGIIGSIVGIEEKEQEKSI